MRIIRTDKTVNYRGFPVVGWANVLEAIESFAYGRSPNATGAVQHNVETYSSSSGMGGALFTLVNAMAGGGLNEFLKRILTKAAADIEMVGRYRGSWDYEGPGPFHKASLGIDRVDEESDTYVLTLSAAYVGDEPEIGLAELLNVERAISSISVANQFEPSTEGHFKINMNTIAMVLSTIFPDRIWDADDLATLMMGNRSLRPAPIYGTATIQVALGIDGIDEYKFDYSSRSKVLKGDLQESWRDDGFQTPSINLSISSQGEGYFRPPIWQEEAKKEALKLTNRIAMVFESLPRTA